MAGVEHTNTSTTVPPVDSPPADAEQSETVTSSTAGNMPQGSLDQPAPLRHGTQTTQNWLPWRYQNFGLLKNTSPSGIWDAWVGLCICLHFISCLYTIFWESTVWTHSTYSITCLPSTTYFSIEGNSLNVVSMVGFWMEGVDQRLFDPSTTAPPEKNPKRASPIETQWVCSCPTKKTR